MPTPDGCKLTQPKSVPVTVSLGESVEPIGAVVAALRETGAVLAFALEQGIGH